MNRLFLAFAALTISMSCLAQKTEQADSISQSLNSSIPQSLKIGYFSYEQALKSMPDYALAQQSVAELRTKYDDEMKRVEQDFNTKYEEFLDGQRDFPETILRKRQTELKELLERNIAFKNESRRQLALTEAEIMAPLKAKLNDVLEQIGLEHGYACIINTDSNAAPFIHPLMGEDINQTVADALK
ncbi:MAG: OmpH family outer membrane protein [Prevotella sp.]|nr:OmpH family outer membrane protein [Prevotella sp.]